MPNQSLSNWTKKLCRDEFPMAASRRVVHGSSAWSLPRGLSVQRQPQDGALPLRVSPIHLSQNCDGNPLSEPEDARITGGTRSLMRRVMGLNVIKLSRKSVAAIRADAQIQAA